MFTNDGISTRPAWNLPQRDGAGPRVPGKLVSSGHPVVLENSPTVRVRPNHLKPEA